MTTPLDVQTECRAHFPALQGGYIFADNAGGSQCLKDVVDRISDYLLNSNAQLGADYSVSVISTKRATVDPQKSAAVLFNAESPEEISFGSSSTMLVENLARAMGPQINEGDEFIVSFADHETNIGPWVRLASRAKATLIPWQARPVSPNDNPFHVELSLDDLKGLITSKTRIVAFTACSNILGAWTRPKEVAALIRRVAREKGARKVEICVDCVAYAPHRRIDVRDWDVEYAFFSYYKVYSPHVSVLYSRKSSLDNSLTSLSHYFLKDYTAGYLKLQPGGPGYEVPYGTTGVLPYLLSLAGSVGVGDRSESELLDGAFQRIAAHEEDLMKPIIGFLLSEEAKKAGVRIVGPESANKQVRAPTISFVVVGQDGKTKRLHSKDVVAEFDSQGGIGIRYGYFYSHRLLSRPDFGTDPNDGVIRVSLLHYNTIEEVQKIADILKRLIVSSN
ncbi:hypothetical protein M407DRAFT_223831 [Tulasnella calospora MUT 4182]|uniref:Aminotransferase class V domain-containing protein n=1 Tax=Tulasnella calospora MUT 4182 TaxID=1051891 RepID=A0A0C3QMH4_9AGAM|nr:hypothetical protein M407DRAFT_223831 [Tulasnella calospora MUT 4182]